MALDQTPSFTVKTPYDGWSLLLLDLQENAFTENKDWLIGAAEPKMWLFSKLKELRLPTFQSELWIGNYVNKYVQSDAGFWFKPASKDSMAEEISQSI